ncbi:MAG: aldo/keto reductase [Acidobacteriales bacterium]|nr:aldo/keto reductase [Terriglobales bacterium]
MQLCPELARSYKAGRRELLVDSPAMLSGFATSEGTHRYAERFPELLHAGHFRSPEHVPSAKDLWFSSIGLGTYLGQPDEQADAAYEEAIVEALRSGINLLDTAINYRHQRSERNIGAALARLTAQGAFRRDQVIICTKAGYLTFDGSLPRDPRRYFLDEFVNRGIIEPSEIAGGMHCMAPRYLEDQIERSRKNLQLETIDVFYVHNPESQLSEIDRDPFLERMRDAFRALEHARKAGRIRFYGCATWNGFRVAAQAREALSLAQLADVAKDIAGENHGFRFVQLPFNLAMPEAFAFKNQQQGRSLLEIAQKLGIVVIGSATLYQGQLTHGLPDSVRNTLGVQSDAHAAIQFARSAPGLTTALIGMGNRQHVVANLAVANLPPASEAEWRELFKNR